MSSLNKVTLIGNLGKDPEMRTTQSGARIANLSLATAENWKDKHSGERRERTEWHRIVIFNERLAEIAEKYLRKGAKVYIEGQLQTRKWTDQQNVERYSTEIVISAYKGEIIMLGGSDRSDYDDRPARSSNGRAAPAAARPSTGRNMVDDDLNDDIPF